MKHNKNYTPKKVIMFFLYTFVCGFVTVLALSHFIVFLTTTPLEGDITLASLIGLTVAVLTTFYRISSGRMGEPIVNMRRYKYWAFSELALFYFFLLMGAIHLFDPVGEFMIEEIVFAIFFGLFGGVVSVLYLIRKDKCNKDN